MRTVNDIKNEMAAAFMSNETLAARYGFPIGAAFDDHFSRVSIESLILYVVAFAIYTLEKLFDLHRTEMEQLLSTRMPHRLKWYYDKALAFQYGRSLMPDSDTYDEVVSSEKIVKYASVVEYQGKLFIKVAKGDAHKEPLTDAELTAITSYFSEIKDAGVKLEVISLPADHIAISIDIYYDPMVLSESGLRLDTGEDSVRNTIRHFVEHGIPFNGQYRNADLIDALQLLDGVIIAELRQASTVPHSDFTNNPTNPPWVTINAYHTPISGYYKFYNDEDLIITFIPYKSVDSL